jgi:hypothetical protein
MTPESPSRPATAAYFVVNALLLLFVLGAAVAAAVAALGALRGGHSISIAGEVPVNDLASLPPTVHAPSYVAVTETIRDASPAQVLLDLAVDITPVLLAVPALWLLRSLVGSLRHGDPFTATNANRLRGVGLLILIGAPVFSIVTHVLQVALSMTLPEGQQLSTTWAPIPVVGWLVGLGVLVLAEVFAHGGRLREDVEGTI